MSVASSAARGNNRRLTVFEDRVEVSTLGVLSRRTDRVRYDRIAGVSHEEGLSYSTVVIETRGGAEISAGGLPKPEAAAAVGLIEERLT